MTDITKPTLDQLLQFRPYSELNEELQHQVVEHAEIRHFTKGSLVFQRGKVPAYYYYLLSGEVSLIDAHFSSRSIYSEDHEDFYRAQSTPCNDSAVAHSDAEILMVSRDYLDLVMVWDSQAHNKGFGSSKVSADQGCITDGFSVDSNSDWMSGLVESPLLNHVPPAHLQQLFSRFQPEEMHADEAIIRQGEKGEYFYVVREGSVRITALSNSLDIILSPGQFFGEEALVGDTTRNATVTAIEHGWLMRLCKEDFVELLQEPILQYLSFEEVQSYCLGGNPAQILDVRLPAEHRGDHIDDSVNLPLHQLRSRLPAFDSDCLYLVTADAGRRAEVAAHLLCQVGYNAAILTNPESHYASAVAVESERKRA